MIPDVSSPLPDLQNQQDTRGVPLDKVGIKGYELPFTVLTKDNGAQQTAGKVSLYTSLNEEVKGANMSRYSQVVSKALAKGHISIHAIKDMLAACKNRLGSTESYVTAKFPFFLKKKAPVSGVESYSKYPAILDGRDTFRDGLRLFVTVSVQYMSLCPCSRQMSAMGTDEKGEVYGKGAHNQRSTGTLTVSLKDVDLSDPDSFVWLEDLISIIESCASCPIYNALKRPDEQYVTEASYRNPKFVEDVARDVALILQQEEWVKRINGFCFVTEHHESIHQYDAVCVKRGGEIYIP
jgi:GTP cyclohydrolase I